MDGTIMTWTDRGFQHTTTSWRQDISNHHSFLWENFTSIGDKSAWR